METMKKMKDWAEILCTEAEENQPKDPPLIRGSFLLFWNARTDQRPIQEVFPDLSPEHREMFITGFCPKCWDEIFGDEEEEDSDE